MGDEDGEGNVHIEEKYMKRQMNKWALRGVVSLMIVGGLIYGAFYLAYSLSHESTDDAYITGVIVPVAAEIKGRVVNVYVRDNQYVSAGNPLLDIFPQDYSDALKERSQTVATLTAERLELEASLMQKQKALARARANLAAATAEEALAEKELKRYNRLVREEAASQSQYDHVESRSKVAGARTKAAEAALAEAEGAIEVARAKLNTQHFKIKEAEAAHSLAELNLKRTTLVAPVSGRIAKKNVDPGKYIQPGQALLSIVKESTWVIANFKETQVGKMAVGQPVDVKIDAYPGIIFKGHVDSLQAGTGAVFSLLPPENATGNFVKVVQRLPVKIVIDSTFDPVHPLWPGLSVIPTVDVSRQTGSKLSGR
ncbi:MAG: putative multidrug resistance protein EmrK [Syntrophorhabdus sp. PtaU1.Bin058]|nr:MAG: putative multidrug resistance protein EmrK [Syntrophorhabdus sp. PtaU1.Bin058]